MRLLDLFAGGGGAAFGYYLAGFDVVGIDIKYQSHYPSFHNADYAKHFKFVQADALEYVAEHGHEFDVIHASPPCQRYSVMTKGRWKNRKYPDLVGETRKALIASKKHYVIENVSGARGILINPIMLCGTMFGLQTKHGNQLIRHRYFECSIPFILTPTCQHNNGSAIGVYGEEQNPARKRRAIGVYGNSGGSSKRDNLVMFGVHDRSDAMGIDWMTGKELSQAIPPAYTEWIGRRIMEAEANLADLPLFKEPVS